jgi:hypothetical protein
VCLGSIAAVLGKSSHPSQPIAPVAVAKLSRHSTALKPGGLGHLVEQLTWRDFESRFERVLIDAQKKKVATYYKKLYAKKECATTN